jgi:hypothetical protein
MEYEIRNRKTATVFFWHDGVWLDVIACGDLGISGWIACLKRAGFPMCYLKKNRRRRDER